MKKSQIFLTLVVSFFLTGCMVSKTQMEEEIGLRDLQTQKLQAQIEELSKEYDSLLSEVRSLKKTNLDLDKEVSKLKGTVQEKDKEIKKFLAEKAEWQQAEEGLMKDIGLLKEDVAGLEKEILAKDTKIKTLGESLAQTEKGGQQAQEIINRLKQENEKITAEISDLQVSVREEKGKLIITMLDKILFDSGKADIKEKAKPTLDKLGKILKEYGNREVLIEGHTDDDPISTAFFPSNWELSARRATTVLRYFVEGHKISPKRISAAGYGEYRPVDSNSTIKGKANNRRVEVILLPQELDIEREKLQ
ncbi:OmpA family protein [bacterium]|nr:OmpA family protein [bacterium]MBU1615025.1 OmpA family protein [bacterium]